MHKLRPSDSPRWTLCAAAAGFTKDMVDPGNQFAGMGTAKHQLAEIALNGMDPEDFMGQELNGFTVDQDFIDQVNWAVAQVNDLAENCEVYTEVSLDLSPWLGEGAKGTADVVLYNPVTKQVTVADYKFGRDKVMADSPQLTLYGLGAEKNLRDQGLEVETVVSVVIQPAIDHYDEVEWDRSDIIAEGEALAAKAAATFADDPEFTPGPVQCRWCLGKATCPALRAEVEDHVGSMDADPFEVMDPDGGDASVLANDLKVIPLIQTWCTARLAHAEQMILSGDEVPGYKVVAGKRGARKWTDEAAALDLLFKRFRVPKAQCMQHKVLSPTQALKLVKDEPRRLKQLESIITQTAGKPAVVPEEDKRPALPVVQFETIEEK